MIIIPANKKVNFATAVPSSKSYTNRALILAALAKGKSQILYPLESDDTKYMIAALKKLGVKIKENVINNATITRQMSIGKESIGQESSALIGGRQKIDIHRNIEQKNCPKIEVWGTGGRLIKPDKQIFLGNAGTAVRFLTAALAAQPFASRVTGNKRMRERPLKDLIEALKKWGAEIKSPTGCPPLKIKGPLTGGTTTVSGSVSSQYLSALLIAAPYCKKPSQIKVKGKLTSLPYVLMTLDIIEKFGGRITSSHRYELFNCTPHEYKGVRYEVEGDASSASYPWAIAALNRGTATITNVPAGSLQADLQFLDVLRKMGCKVDYGNRGNQKVLKGITVTGPDKLKALGTIDLNRMPDAAMTVAILCVFADGKSRLTGLGNLRVKETDRLLALETELKKTGVKVKTGKDWIEIEGCAARSPNPHGAVPHAAKIETYDDHRMAMCFAVMGSRIPGIDIQNPGCVSKTYPDFFTDYKKWTSTTS